MDFQSIKATCEDATNMGFIHSQSWQKAYRGIIPDEIVNNFTAENRAKIFVEAISTRPEEYYLFKVDGKPAGIALLNKSHEENAPDYLGEIYAIYFHPDYWGTSATHKGFEFCIDRLKKLGFSEITIWVLKANARARKFYEKYGFSLDGAEQEIFIGKPLIEVRYSKKV